MSAGFHPDQVLWGVDVQRDFMLPGGALYVPGAEKIIPAIARLVNACREAGALLISSADAHSPTDRELLQWPPHCMKGTPGAEIVPEATLERRLIVPNDATFRLPATLEAVQQIIIHKNQLDVFTNPNTEAVLGALPVSGIRADAEFIVFGVVTEYCVQFAAEGLLQRGRRVAVVTDAIKEIDASKGECSLRDFQEHGARLVQVEEVIRMMAGAKRKSA